jgi:polyisoprenoid-binding protein YceI
MTSMLRLALRALVLPAIVCFTAACPAQNTPAPAAAPAPAPAASPAPATRTAAAGAATYVLDPAKSKLEFLFRQAGAENKGQFTKYDVTLTAPGGGDLAGASLDVTVDVSSLDTADGERDGLLRDVDLFNVKKFPTARFVAEKLTKTGSGYEANGKLTVRDVTRDVKVPLAFKAAGNGGQLTGKTTLRRLDFGVGQGDWKSTEWVDDEVTVQLDLHLTRK